MPANLNRYNTSLGEGYNPLVIREVPPDIALGWFTASPPERPVFNNDNFAVFATSTEAYLLAVENGRIAPRVQGSGEHAGEPRLFVFTSHVDDPIAAGTRFNDDTDPTRLFGALANYGASAAEVAHVMQALTQNKNPYQNRDMYHVLQEHFELGPDVAAMDERDRAIYETVVVPAYLQRGIAPERVARLIVEAQESGKRGVIVVLSWNMLQRAGITFSTGDPGQGDCSLLARHGVPLDCIIAAIPIADADGRDLELQFQGQ